MQSQRLVSLIVAMQAVFAEPVAVGGDVAGPEQWGKKRQQRMLNHIQY